MSAEQLITRSWKRFCKEMETSFVKLSIFFVCDFLYIGTTDENNFVIFISIRHRRWLFV